MHVGGGQVSVHVPCRSTGRGGERHDPGKAGRLTGGCHMYPAGAGRAGRSIKLVARSFACVQLVTTAPQHKCKHPWCLPVSF